MNLLKIENHIINLDQMTHIELQGESDWSAQVKSVCIHFSDGKELVLDAAQANRFRDWFKRHIATDDSRVG